MKAIVLAAALALVFGHASAYDVTNLNDSGAGSLRDAVAQANANPGPDTITFSVTGTILLTSGQLSINDPLTIVGPGAGALTIDGNANGRVFSIFENVPNVCATPGSNYLVSISGVTITNGRNPADSRGGAIYTEKSLALTSVVVSNSVAKDGGGLNVNLVYPGQALTIDDSTFTNNIARPLPSSTSGTQGGAINVRDLCVTSTNPVTISISRSLFSSNHAQPTIFLDSGGGAIWIDSFADVTIIDSRIVGNSIDPPVPPVAGANYRAGGARVQNARSLTVERTEISDNSANRLGGLSLNSQLPSLQTPANTFVAKIVNSTISGNIALAPPAVAPVALGMYGNVALELDNTTVAGNTTLSGSVFAIQAEVGPTFPASAGNTLAPTLSMRSSIVSNPALASEVGVDGVVLTSLVVNADESLVRNLGSGVSLSGTGNLTGVDPVLGPLAFNGGTTRTHAPMPSSPAINAGSNPLGLGTDQRGATFPRIALGGIDMGAYEVVLTPLAGDWDGNGADTIGLHFPTSGAFAFKNANAPGAADLFFGYGPIDPSWIALSGDWDGNGTRTPGLYNPATGFFFLRNSSNPGPADLMFGFGPGGSRLVPLSGDWNNDGVDTVGLYDSGTGVFFLRNANSAGIADVVFSFGVGDPDVVPVVGDWDGDGTTTAGLYDAQTSTFFLRNSNSPGAADLTFSFGAASPSYVPIVGNWDGAAGQSIALYDRRTGVFFLRNANSDGAADVVFGFGPGGP